MHAVYVTVDNKMFTALDLPGPPDTATRDTILATARQQHPGLTRTASTHGAELRVIPTTPLWWGSGVRASVQPFWRGINLEGETTLGELVAAHPAAALVSAKGTVFLWAKSPPPPLQIPQLAGDFLVVAVSMSLMFFFLNLLFY